MGKMFPNAMLSILDKKIDFNSDALVWTLHASGLSSVLATAVNASDLTNELSAGGGYTVGTAGGGGLAAAGVSMTLTVANSWGVSRANTTAYALGDIVRPATGNGFLYRCSTAGTSGGSIPTYPTVIGQTVTDGGAQWECIGSAIVVCNATDPVWASFTAGPARYAVLSDRTPGTLATDPLIAYVDFITDKTGGSGNFTVDINGTTGVFHFLIP